jgi:hypothetical protein
MTGSGVCIACHSGSGKSITGLWRIEPPGHGGGSVIFKEQVAFERRR